MKEQVSNQKPEELEASSKPEEGGLRQDPIEITLAFKRNAIDEAIVAGAPQEEVEALKTDLATFAIMSGSL